MAVICLAACKEDFKASGAYDRGNEVYITHCLSCHGQEGEGFTGLYPPLNQRTSNLYSNQRALRLIRNGSPLMRPISLTEEEMKDVLNYINNSWGVESDTVSLDSVRSLLNQ